MGANVTECSKVKSSSQMQMNCDPVYYIEYWVDYLTSGGDGKYEMQILDATNNVITLKSERRK